MTNIVRYGLISTASIGFGKHLPGSLTSRNSEIVAVSSRTLKSAEAAAEKHGIPLAFGSYQEMIDSDQIDAVINTLPNSMHHKWSIKAAKAGKHVLCEKPLSATMAQAREMAAAANEHGIVLVEGFTPRWNKQMRTIRELISQGEIGEIIRIDTCLTFTREDLSDIRFSKELAGGSMMDAGGYAVYAARFAMGSEPIQAAGFERKRAGIEVDTTFSGLLKFPCGAVANVWSSLEGPRQLPFIATGTKGTISLEQSFEEDVPVIISKAGVEEVMEMQSVDRFQAQLDEFSECVLTNKPPEFPIEDGMRNMAALLALYESARSESIIKIEEIS
ncbi:MAG: Gfo/Idh/MocA family oxidoreductase [Paracoccaceae bacterium]